MYVGGQRISKHSYFINNKPIFLKLRIFTNFNTVFPVLVLGFYFEDFSEEVLHGHYSYSYTDQREVEISV
jgi:hypothetical protein